MIAHHKKRSRAFARRQDLTTLRPGDRHPQLLKADAVEQEQRAEDRPLIHPEEYLMWDRDAWESSEPTTDDGGDHE